MQWYGESFLNRIESEIGARVEVAGNTVAAEMRTLISIQGPPRSKPDQSPHRDTGDLWASTKSTRSGLTAKIGSPLHYALDLELGRTNMLPRPFIRRALANTLTAVESIILRDAAPPSTPA